MFKNAGMKFTLGFCFTCILGLLIFIVSLIVEYVPKFGAYLLAFLIISFAIGSLLFRLGFRYDEDGDLIREIKKYDDC